jgi:hypothetical protein
MYNTKAMNDPEARLFGEEQGFCFMIHNYCVLFSAGNSHPWVSD